MSILAFILSLVRPKTKSVTIDLGTFKCGHSTIGMCVDSRDFFAQFLRDSDVYELSCEGFEVGTKDERLDYLFLALKYFRGGFSKHGSRIVLSWKTTPEDVRSEFGEPYWIDTDDHETIMFYELEGGSIELQFEFPGKRNLGFITFMRDGVLSKEEQRQRYGVTKPWPTKSV